MKKGDRFRLTCGHEGRVIWVSTDGHTFCVQGVNRRCSICGKGASGGWTPTVYCIQQAAGDR